MSPADDGGPAFPEPGLSGLPNGEFIHSRPGMSLRAYFMAHAPATPPASFRAVMKTSCPPKGAITDEAANRKRREWIADAETQRHLQWPAAWADAQLEQLKDTP